MKTVLLMVLPAVALGATLSAATYYVDYEAGNDAWGGTNTAAPWKRCPGDVLAVANANRKLVAGDVVVFKRGQKYESTWAANGSGKVLVESTNATVAADGLTLTAPNAGFVSAGVVKSNYVYVDGEGVFTVAAVVSENELKLSTPTFHQPLSGVPIMVGQPIIYTTQDGWGTGSVLFANPLGKPPVTLRNQDCLLLDGGSGGFEFTGSAQTALYGESTRLVKGMWLRNINVHDAGLSNIFNTTIFWAQTRKLAAPPTVSSNNSFYIVASPASGEWQWHQDEVAQNKWGKWRFYAPLPGLRCNVMDENAFYAWDGTAWMPSTNTSKVQPGWDRAAIYLRLMKYGLLEDVAVSSYGDFVENPFTDKADLDIDDDGIKLAEVYNCTLNRCRIDDIGDDGIAGQPGPFYVQFSEITHMDVWNIHCDTIQGYTAGEWTIRYNSFHDNFRGLMFTTYDPAVAVIKVHIHHNLFYRNRGFMPQCTYFTRGEFYNNIVAYNSYGMLIYNNAGEWDVCNNIFYENGLGNQREIAVTGTSVPLDRIRLRNNHIIRRKINPTDKVIQWGPGKYYSVDQFKALKCGPNGDNGEGFVFNSAARYFKSEDRDTLDLLPALATSPQVGAGLDLGLRMRAALDHRQVRRSPGQPPSVGAFEWSASVQKPKTLKVLK